MGESIRQLVQTRLDTLPVCTDHILSVSGTLLVYAFFAYFVFATVTLLPSQLLNQMNLQYHYHVWRAKQEVLALNAELDVFELELEAAVDQV